MSPDGKTQTGGEIVNPCKFEHIFELINKVVNFALFQLALPIAAVMFAYAGFFDDILWWRKWKEN